MVLGRIQYGESWFQVLMNSIDSYPSEPASLSDQQPATKLIEAAAELLVPRNKFMPDDHISSLICVLRICSRR